MTEVQAPVGVQQKLIGIATKQKTWPHVRPGLAEEPTGQDCPMNTCVQAPVVLLQQAVTHGLVGTHVPPCVHGPLHSDWIEMVQFAEPCWQQAPIGGQGLKVGEPRHEDATEAIQPCGQAVARKIWHAPVVTLQQTDCGGTHGGGGQATPMPRNTPGCGHAALLGTVMHAPVA
jgi:hypothetical protein